MGRRVVLYLCRYKILKILTEYLRKLIYLFNIHSLIYSLFIYLFSFYIFYLVFVRNFLHEPKSRYSKAEA